MVATNNILVVAKNDEMIHEFMRIFRKEVDEINTLESSINIIYILWFNIMCKSRCILARFASINNECKGAHSFSKSEGTLVPKGKY